ncbi:MAG: peptidoglycan editing factor PgeF [Pseudomonadota bacterium]|jgi:YfiH family protein
MNEYPVSRIPGFPPNVHAVMTSRGASETPWGFNLAVHTGEPGQAVAARRQALEDALGVQVQWLSQVHGAACHVATEITTAPAADACMTTNPFLACAVMVADCLPVLMSLESGASVAAAHAGWRGLASGVLESSLAALVRHQDDRRVVAWLGPCIGPYDFEVGPEVLEAFGGPEGINATHFQPSPLKQGHWMADLQGLAQSAIERWISAHDCEIRWAAPPGGCTIRESKTWFSYRRERVTGRMAGLIWRESQ